MQANCITAMLDKCAKVQPSWKIGPRQPDKTILQINIHYIVIIYIYKAFFNYLVYGAADPIFQDLGEKNKILFYFIFYCNFFLRMFSCRSQARITEGQIHYGVLGTQELEPTDIGKKQGMETG